MERAQGEVAELKYLQLDRQRFLRIQTPLFIGTLAVGAIAISLAKYFFTGGLVFWLLGVLFPAMLMIAYVVANWRFQFFDSTRSQVADNCYFLGFLYFLVSLSITLTKVVRLDGIQQVDVPQIIEGFGIALVTTILGLLLRIILLQNATNLSASRDASEETLLSATNRFRDHLVSMTDNLRITQDAILGAMRDSVLASSRSLETAVDAATKTVSSTTDAVQRSVTSAGEAFTSSTSSSITMFRQSLESIDLPVDMLTKEIAPSVEALATTLRQSVDTTKKLGDSMARGVNRLDKVIGSFDSLEIALAHYANSAKTAEEASNKLLDGQRQLKDLLESLAGSIKALDAATRSATETTEVAQRLAQAAAATSSKLNGIGTTAIATAEQMSETLRNADQVAEAFTEVKKTIGAIQSAVSSESEALTRAMSDSKETVRSHTAEYAKVIEDATSDALVQKQDGARSPRKMGFWRT